MVPPGSGDCRDKVPDSAQTKSWIEAARVVPPQSAVAIVALRLAFGTAMLERGRLER